MRLFKDKRAHLSKIKHTHNLQVRLPHLTGFADRWLVSFCLLKESHLVLAAELLKEQRGLTVLRISKMPQIPETRIAAALASMCPQYRYLVIFISPYFVTIIEFSYYTAMPDQGGTPRLARKCALKRRNGPPTGDMHFQH